MVSLNTRFYREREYFSSGVNTLTNSLNISDTTKTELFKLISPQGDQKNMTKILPCRFNLCFGPFIMLSIHKFSDRALFTHLSSQLFTVYKFRKKSPMSWIFSFKVFQIWCIFRKWRNKLKKYFLNWRKLNFLCRLSKCLKKYKKYFLILR